MWENAGKFALPCTQAIGVNTIHQRGEGGLHNRCWGWRGPPIAGAPFATSQPLERHKGVQGVGSPPSKTSL